MEIPFEGGCACGTTRFQCGTYPLAMYNCHCRGCQKTGGTPYAPLVVVPVNHVIVSGNQRFLKSYTNDDPHPKRAVCAECGSMVFAASGTTPELLLLNAMAFDDPSWYCPVADIWTCDAQHWVEMNRQIPKVFKSPPLLGDKVI